MKGSTVIAIGVGKPKKGNLLKEADADEADEEYADDDDESVAADDLADVLEVPKEKRAAFRTALKSYVETCALKATKDE